MSTPRATAETAALAPTGTLRAVINLGNPVLAQGGAEHPSGVTVDLATELARRLGVGVRLHCVDAARHSFEALRAGEVDVAFLAVEPARAEQVAFTAPYLIIEGVFAVPSDSAISSADEVDRDGVRIGVKEGSAYDLYLTRTLQHADLVRGADGVAVCVEQGLEVAAGIRQPVAAFVAGQPGYRLVEPRFMEIRQALAIGRQHSAETLGQLQAVLTELTAGGFVAAALERSGQVATVAS